jgi:hypothetical protein
MEPTWLQKLANWNPQLVRELRGRLKPQSLSATIILSLILQTLLVIGVNGSLRYNPQPAAVTGAWRSLWEMMVWILTYILLGMGAFLLSNDIAQEERAGTLNFIRSSPRPPYQILLGKFLGVPILPYIAVGLALPLHWVAGLRGGVPVWVMLSFDVLLVAGCVLFFSPALLLGLVQNPQQKPMPGYVGAAFPYTTLLLTTLIPLYLIWNFQTNWRSLSLLMQDRLWTGFDFYWGFLPLSSNAVLSNGFTCFNIAVISFFVWQMLLRRFYSPTVTSLSKRLSYALTVYLQLLVIGFALRPTPDSTTASAVGVALYWVNLILFASLIFALTPSRQAIIDWLRYRQTRLNPAASVDLSVPASGDTAAGTLPSLSSLALWRDFVWADGSPSVVAIMVNVVIVCALAWPWLGLEAGLFPPLKVLSPSQLSPGEVMVDILMFSASTALTMLIYGTLVQRLFISRLRNPRNWALGILLSWATIPPTLFRLLGFTDVDSVLHTAAWTVWGSPLFVTNSLERANAYWGAALGLIIQALCLGILLWQLFQHLRQLASKVLKD